MWEIQSQSMITRLKGHTGTVVSMHVYISALVLCTNLEHITTAAYVFVGL